MNSTQIVKQMIDFQKTTLDNIFNAVVLVQEQGEKITNTLFEQISWLPEENKRLLDQWMSMAKKGRDDLKSAMDDNFKNVSDLLASK
jgi:gas vesicle protein